MITEKCYQRNLDFETALLIIFVTFVLSKMRARGKNVFE